MNKVIKFGRHTIGEGQPPFIIAEMSGNHNHSLDRAMALVDAAAEAGAHALKIQTSSPDMLTIDSYKEDFIVKGSNKAWERRSLYNLYQEAYTPLEWQEKIFQRGEEKGLVVFSSPFGLEAVDFLEDLGCPIYKIASFEANFTSLLQKVARTGKPVIVSTGTSSLKDILDIVDVFKEEGNQNLMLLKCTSAYPASPSEANLRTIPHLQAAFDGIVGLSDHTLGIGVSVAAVALGAKVIEKHFTINRSEGGIDSSFSLEPQQLKDLVTETKAAYESLGTVNYEPNSTSSQFSRSIYATADIKEGQVFTEENIRVIRPGYGLAPKNYEALIGRKATCNLDRGTAISWSHIY